MKTVIENATIITINDKDEIIDNGYLEFDEGLITSIGSGEYSGSENVYKIDGTDSIIIPGLINAHTHSYANIVKGTAENLPLEIWMLYIMAEGKNMNIDDYSISSLLGSIELLKGGTTTFLDHVGLDLDGFKRVANDYYRIGIRPILTPMFGDIPYGNSLSEQIDLEGVGSKPHGPSSKANSSWKEIAAMAEEVINTVKNPEKNIYVGIGPSGPQRVTDDLLVASMEIANRYDIPLHMHVLETKSQEAAAYRLYGKSMVSHLHDLDMLHPRVSFAHSVWVNGEDIALMGEKGVSIVHNPYSNLLLGSGLAPIIPIKEAGINIALGSDGANCSGNQSMFESIKLASVLSNVSTTDHTRWVKAYEVLKMATIGGARAVGMEDYIGSLETGKSADMVLLDKKSTTFVPLNDMIWQLVYGHAENTIKSVYVSGKRVVADKKILTVDETVIYEEGLERGRHLLDSAQQDYLANKTEEIKIQQVLDRLYKK